MSAVKHGLGIIPLYLKTTVPGKGGTVRSCIVLPRERAPPPGQPFTHRFQVALALESEIQFTNQPRFIQLEYRIMAANTNGLILSSNLMAMVV